ncbi:hypothetical protein [Pseudomonas alvandae]|uniref:Uncharacterized protein n=1 Tax=Pseudomonas canavaninivorans TaxID=2842348 RepID=A0ABX8QK47_PSECO|nr:MULTISPECIES: hypothetical protein [Pseudomonas]QXI55610.1 hypothetical protein KSS97_11950 [Pseudomonas alvandae]
MQLFLESSVGPGSLRHATLCLASMPIGDSAPEQGSGRSMMVRRAMMLGNICDEVLIQATECAGWRLMNFFSESRQVFFGKMQRSRSNFPTRYCP